MCPEGHVFTKGCVLQCHSGYRATGVTSVTCDSTGQWSSRLGPCTGQCMQVHASRSPVFLFLSPAVPAHISYTSVCPGDFWLGNDVATTAEP